MLPLAAGSAGLVLVVALAASSRVLPGVRVAGLDVGGLSTAMVETELEREWLERPLELTASERSSLVSAAELGLVVDAGATAREARDVGRAARYWASLLRGGSLRTAGPVWTLDRERAVTTLSALAPELGSPAAPTRLEIRDGVVHVMPARTGNELDVDAALATLQADAESLLETGRLEMPTRPVSATERDLSVQAAAAQERLLAPVRVAVFDPIADRTESVELSPEEWQRWVVPDAHPTEPTGLVWLARSELPAGDAPWQPGPGRFLDPTEVASAIATALTSGSGTCRVRHAPSSYTVQSGDTIADISRRHGIPYPWLLAANPDVADEVWPGQTLLVPSPDTLVPLAPIQGKRILVSLADQRMQAIENGVVRWDWPVSTGVPESPTSPGVFQVQTREPVAYARTFNLHMPSFVGIYRPDPDSTFMNGFHGYPTRDGVGLLWQGDLGRPVTYGCVLLDGANAAELYDWAEPGVVVEIRP